ncbi:MAG: ATP-binding protein, partial [Phormidesmis sp.]
EHKQNEASLQAADQHKDEFLASLGHELRNPLNSLASSLRLMRKAELSAAQAGDKQTWRNRQAEFRAIADRQVEQLTRLINDLLDVSRVTYGKVQLQHKPMDLMQLLMDLAEDYRVDIFDKELTVGISLPGGTVWISGDSARLTQAFSNILRNAIKFSDLGGRIEISAKLNKNEVEASITDSGIGIEADALSRIFTAFSQEDRSLARSGGLGLGLPLAKGIVELHGGSIWASSPGLDRGTTVSVALPRLMSAPEDFLPNASASEAEQTQNGGPPSSSSQSLERSLRVLVVEDNLDSAFMAELFIEDLGHQIEVAYDGESSIEIARRFQPEIVISDIGLPGETDGYAIARAIRSDPTLSRAYLIATSGYGQPEDKAKAVAAGFDEHLTKPLDLNFLRKLIDQQAARLSSE